jgi:hypothetical protein
VASQGAGTRSETLDGIIRMLMDINAKLERLLGEEEDGWEDEP